MYFNNLKCLCEGNVEVSIDVKEFKVFKQQLKIWLIMNYLSITPQICLKNMTSDSGKHSRSINDLNAICQCRKYIVHEGKNMV